MAVGWIETSVLTDIANAIREKGGTTAKLLPREMAAAVTALDGTLAGEPTVEPYMELERGLVSEGVFSGIADAIRAQNGETTLYTPREMAPAILALEWDVGVKLRALLIDNGFLEINYRDGVRNSFGANVQQVFEVDPAGYSSAGARPWDAVKAKIHRVVIDDDVAGAGVTDCSYWFHGFVNLIEITGFDALQNVSTFNQTFVSCGSLRSIYVDSWAPAATHIGSLPFNGCKSLVGGQGFVPTNLTGISALEVGESGVLTVLGSDARSWYYGHLFDTGELVITADQFYDGYWTAVASGMVCAEGRYQALGYQPWWDSRSSVTSVTFDASMAGFAELNLNYLLDSLSSATSVSGLGNLANVRQMRYAFADCTALTELDFSGFDPSTLTDLFYCFSGCGLLTTIWVDATWELPASGVSGMSCFYGCGSLVGGGGTKWTSSTTSYTYMRIDDPEGGAPGYLTAKS